MKTTLLILVTLTLAACTATYQDSRLPDNHPANPGAEAGPLSEQSRTLAITSSAVHQSPMAEASGQHEGHGAGGHDPTSPSPSGEPAAGHAKDAGKAATPAPPAALYACPMHPEVTSDKPDQRCPKCGMKLVKKNGGSR